MTDLRQVCESILTQASNDLLHHTRYPTYVAHYATALARSWLLMDDVVRETKLLKSALKACGFNLKTELLDEALARLDGGKK